MVGRPSGEPLDLEMPGPVAQDVVEVDPRGRVLLPPRIVADMDGSTIYRREVPKASLSSIVQGY